VFNYSVASGFIVQSRGFWGKAGRCLSFGPAAPGSSDQVILPTEIATTCNTSWDAVAVGGVADGVAGGTAGGTAGGAAGGAVQLRIRAGSASGGDGRCLTFTAPVPAPDDEWCIENNNLWRSSTDVLQVWSSVMVQAESMATQGYISRPGAWSFPDAMELGSPGGYSLTWEEAKSNLALFAVTSSPLFLGNDPRTGRMQERLVDLLLNPDMLAVDQQYSAEAAFAGGRIKAEFPAKELWAKPLAVWDNAPARSAAVVLLNRGGTAVGISPAELPDHCTADPSQPCNGCFIDADQPQLSPCDDNVTASTGAAELVLKFADLPRSWLGLGPDSADGTDGGGGGSGGGGISCNVYDIYGCPHAGCTTRGAAQGVALGRFVGQWAATIPPHGSRFLRLSGCTASADVT
jgi:hypothetical protein